MEYIKKLTQEEIDKEYKENELRQSRLYACDGFSIRSDSVVVEDRKIVHQSGIFDVSDSYAVTLSGKLRHDYPVKRGYTKIEMELHPNLSLMLQWFKIWVENKEVALISKALIKHKDQLEDADPESFDVVHSVKGMYDTLTTVIKSLNRMKSSLEPFSNKEENSFLDYEEMNI